MEIQVKFDPYSAADRDRVRLILDSFPTARAKPVREDSATDAVIAILERHGGQARHAIIRNEMKTQGFPGWQTPKLRLLRAGKIDKLSRGLYGIAKKKN